MTATTAAAAPDIRVKTTAFAENDDLLCAVRYALMMLRYARTSTAARNFNRKIEYPKWNAI
jgi:hypothetical protein